MATTGEPGRPGERPQSVAGGPTAPPTAAAWVGGWGALLCLAAWMPGLAAPWLWAAALGSGLWAWHGARRSSSWSMAALALLCLGLGVAAGVQLRLWQVATHWPAVRLAIEEEAAAELNQALNRLVERGEAAVSGMQPALLEGASARSFERLEALRSRAGVDALAVFDSAGAPVIWAGEHRGTVPRSVREGGRSYQFLEGPLFSYLYFVRSLPDGGSVMAADLLEANLAVDRGSAPFAERFAQRRGVTPRFTSPERARGDAVWDWSTDRPILSVSFAALTQQHWWVRVSERGRSAVSVVWLIALVALSIGWYRQGRSPGLPVGLGTLGLLLLPLEELLDAESLFSPMQFVLPLPGDVTLGMLLVLLAGGSVWLLTRTGDEADRGLPLWVRTLLTLPLFPAVLALIQRSASGGLLAGRPAGGLELLLVSALLLGVPLFLLLRGGAPGRERVPRVVLMTLGVLLTAVLSLGVVWVWHPASGLPLLASALWALPFWVFAHALARSPRRRRTVRSWLVAGWLGGSAALAWLWPMHAAAELQNAEHELAGLGTQPDTFLDFLLHQFARQATEFAREGEQGVNLLYHSWVASGLAREGFEARLTLWQGGEPATELRLSSAGDTTGLVRQQVARFQGQEEPVVRRFERVQGLHYLLLAPLPGGRVATVAVPPRTQLERATALARFLHPESEGEEAAENESLRLVPVAAEGAALDSTDMAALPVSWERVPSGWRSEARARFPSGWMHAHLLVRAPPLPLMVVRGLLVQAAILAMCLVLWLLARLLCGEYSHLSGTRRPWVRSFRARLTVALFVFFLIPTALFGAVAYGAVAREVIRSAAALSLRALEQASARAAGEPLAAVSAEVRSDLLLYRGGTLVSASAPEILDLGLFQTWLPPEVYLQFAHGEEFEESEERMLGESNYLVAYRRVEPGAVLAAPVPLAADEITRRRQEFRDIALLVSMLGATLSVVLSLLVGRTLARPIDQLSRAVARVGTGNLRVRLPEEREDEFGGVYRAFNRMVRQLRRARRALVRETRRTETIVAEAATGVLALNGDGRVELVNPRAAEILGVPLPKHEPLPRTGTAVAAVAAAVDTFARGSRVEGGSEIQLDGRTLRLRIRRIAGTDGMRGLVLALEDVTSEVRTARVLAWGEMARQVAHEIKNPLTPIKLAVQHIRRAYFDRRPDYDQILERNVEAILREIDRLGEISRAFARFGAPSESAGGLQRVDVPRVVQETLALYRGAGNGIHYHVDTPDPLPLLAAARSGELKEVLVNLLENARESLDGTGEIRVRVHPSGDRRWVELDVADTGEGIPVDMLPHIFEPHFSTRTSGTGLGLAIVRRLVESWGGDVAVQSEPGIGTRIRLRLVALEEAPTTAAADPGP